MRILHLGTGATPEEVNGVNSVVWTLAAEQSRIGDQVAFLMGGNSPAAKTEAHCDALSIKAFWVPANRFSYHLESVERVLEDFCPDVVHMHAIFIPRQATLSRFLYQKRIPYVISPHGGCSPRVLDRQQWKKWPYSVLIEKPRFRHAAAIIPITVHERKDASDYVGNRGRLSAPVGNPVSIPPGVCWPGDPGNCRRVVSLTRFSVFPKGLDRLVEIARRLPTANFCVYGQGERSKDLAKLIRTAPPNVSFLPPVFGNEKWQVLQSAALYLQTSRWEGFGIAAAEAVAVGLPCAVLPGEEPLREILQQAAAGFALSADCSQAAAEIEGVLADRDSRQRRGAAGARYAREHWSATSVAEAVASRYQEAICTAGSSELRPAIAKLQ